MKKIIPLLFFFVLNSEVSFSEVISLESVTQKVKVQNLSVLQNAERVYQAKVSIDEARLNMLPRLNLWNIGKVVIEPSAILDVIQEVAPFLVPSNWFRLKETELLFTAEKQGYLALKANEVFSARSLYLKVLLDQELYKSLLKHEVNLSTIKNIAEDRLDLGLENTELVREIQIQHLNIKEDLEKMKVLVDYEKSVLSQALGISVKEELELDSIKFPDGSVNQPMEPNAWEADVLKKSPELIQFQYLIKVIPEIKKEIRFSFLGVPSISRGTAGGIFDDMPVSQGLGFSNGKQIDIVKSKESVMKLQLKGIEETLKRQVLNVSQEHNASLRIRSLQKERLELSELNFKAMSEKFDVGNPVSLGDFSQTVLSLLQSQAAYSEALYSFIINYDKLQRMAFVGPYESLLLDSTPTAKDEAECRKTIFGRKVCKEKGND